MAADLTVTFHCDLCGYGGAYTRADDFRHFGDVDLCIWCARPTFPEWIESGGHRCTFTPDGTHWTCNCGTSHGTVFAPKRVLAAVPHLPTATANAHIHGKTLVAIPQ